MKHLLIILCLFVSMVASAANVQSKSTPWLVKKLQRSKDTALRVEVLKVLGQRRDISTLFALEAAAEDPSLVVRRAALKSMIRYGPDIDHVGRDRMYIELLADVDTALRDLAIRGCFERIDSGNARVRRGVLKQVNAAIQWRSRHSAMKVLQSISGSDVDEAIIKAVRNEQNAIVRRLAVEVVGSRKIAAAAPLLNTVRTQDLDEQVQRAAEDALRRMGTHINDKVMAVMPIKASPRKLAEKVRGFDNYLSSRLASSGLLKVVERGEVSRVMAELAYQDRNIFDGDAIQVGRALRASRVVLPSAQQQGNTITMIVKLIDVATMEIIASAEVSGVSDDLDAIRREVVTRFMGDI
jgi:TolB-like protein